MLYLDICTMWAPNTYRVEVVPVRRVVSLRLSALPVLARVRLGSVRGRWVNGGGVG